MSDDLEQLAPILNALQRMTRDPSTYTSSLDAVDAQFSEILDEEMAKHERSNCDLGSGTDSKRLGVLSAIRRPKARDELLARIQQACGLTDRQVRLLRDTGLLTMDKNDKPVIRRTSNILLTREKATASLLAISCLLGMAIWSILTDDAPGLVLLLRGIGLGIAIGSITGFVLARSYRAYPILEKLESIQPWLSNQHVLGKG